MEDLIQHKNRTLFRIETELQYEIQTKDVWNGRDSDELHGFDTETVRVFTGTNVKIFKAITDATDLEKKLGIIKQIDDICNSNYIPRYNRHVKVNTSYELYHEFDVEDKLESLVPNSEVLIHHGIKGSYPVQKHYGFHFDIEKMLWSYEHPYQYQEETESLLKDLILIALEDKNIRIDERYI